MKKIVAVAASFLTCYSVSGQLKPVRLSFEQGQTLEINLQIKSSFSQQAMGQAIDFHVDGSAIHLYRVTNATDDNSTLRHEMKRISFQFEGMGQKTNFDSDNKKDLDGRFGQPVKDVLDKTYDMIIDPNGKVLMVHPEKIENKLADERMRIITDMLRELLGVVQPPKKGEGSFFRVLPENEAAIGESWSESGQTDNGTFTHVYTLAEVNDSTILVNLNGTSTATTKADMMGMETTTNLNNKTTGVIVVDKATGIVRSKKFETESTGNTQIMGNAIPISSKTTTDIQVNPLKQ